MNKVFLFKGEIVSCFPEYLLFLEHVRGRSPVICPQDTGEHFLKADLGQRHHRRRRGAGRAAARVAVD